VVQFVSIIHLELLPVLMWCLERWEQWNVFYPEFEVAAAPFEFQVAIRFTRKKLEIFYRRHWFTLLEYIIERQRGFRYEQQATKIKVVVLVFINLKSVKFDLHLELIEVGSYWEIQSVKWAFEIVYLTTIVLQLQVDLFNTHLKWYCKLSQEDFKFIYFWTRLFDVERVGFLTLI